MHTSIEHDGKGYAGRQDRDSDYTHVATSHGPSSRTLVASHSSLVFLFFPVFQRLSRHILGGPSVANRTRLLAAMGWHCSLVCYSSVEAHSYQWDHVLNVEEHTDSDSDRMTAAGVQSPVEGRLYNCSRCYCSLGCTFVAAHILGATAPEEHMFLVALLGNSLGLQSVASFR